MIPFVVDVDGSDCYGRYLKNRIPPRIPDDSVTVLDSISDLQDYNVVEWTYEKY